MKKERDAREPATPAGQGWPGVLHQAFTDVFLGSLALYLVLLLVELVKKEAAACFIDLRVVFWVALVSGGLAVMTSRGRVRGEQHARNGEAPPSRLFLAAVVWLTAAGVALAVALSSGGVRLLLAMGAGFLLVLLAPGLA